MGAVAVIVIRRACSGDSVEPPADLSQVVELLVGWANAGVGDADPHAVTFNRVIGPGECGAEVGIGAVVGYGDGEVLLDADDSWQM